MQRIDIINKIGREYLTSNIENDEFSYKKALKRPFSQDEKHYKLDLRFENANCSILIETKLNSKKDFSLDEENQLIQYTKLEREYKSRNKIISILYNLQNDNIKVWKNEIELTDEYIINSFKYYLSLFEDNKINDKNNVLETTNSLNNDLNTMGVSERLRSQFVGCLLVALNNGLIYDNGLKTNEIIGRINDILDKKINDDENKKSKINPLKKILNEQNIKNLKNDNFQNLLDKIKDNLIPYINSKTSQGEDLLNLFFTTFNKYVGKADKNQAFTPTHITDFMCEITNLNENSKVLDPTCGSGSFLVQAMIKMLQKAGNNESLKKSIKQKQLFGIEESENVFGLATTNMLIHEDGRSNVIQANCFNKREWIQEQNINVVLMNPPFNAVGGLIPKDCPRSSKKNMDATKGLYFVHFIADAVKNGTLATILPLQCAIGSDQKIHQYKTKILKTNTLKAVFSLPDEIFYPGASVNACIMLFNLGVPHNSNIPTFFGFFKEDGFIKRKNKGRVEKIDWEKTKSKWLEAFNYSKEIPGLSVLRKVSADDEWLAEAYMETDYSKLKENNFVKTIRDFISFKVKSGEIND